MSWFGTKEAGKRAKVARQGGRRRSRMAAAKAGHRDVDPIAIWERDGGVCCLCRLPVPLEDFTLEHKVPVSKGGQHVPSNLGVAHRSCNSEKGARTRPRAHKGLRRRLWKPKPKRRDLPDDVF